SAPSSSRPTSDGAISKARPVTASPRAASASGHFIGRAPAESVTIRSRAARRRPGAEAVSGPHAPYRGSAGTPRLSPPVSDPLLDGPARRRELLLGHGRELPRKQGDPRRALKIRTPREVRDRPRPHHVVHGGRNHHAAGCGSPHDGARGGDQHDGGAGLL